MFENVVCEMSAILSRPQCVNNADSVYFNILWNKNTYIEFMKLPVPYWIDAS